MTKEEKKCPIHKRSLTYRLHVWCKDCRGEDFQGCFGGGEDTDDFCSYENAERAGEFWTEDSIYEYSIDEPFCLTCAIENYKTNK